MTPRVRAGILILFGLLPFLSLRAEENHVHAQLLYPSKGIIPGEQAYLTLSLDIDPEWHIYWRNPGDAGTATEIEWKLPEGYAVDSIAWPLPHAIGEPPEVSYGYENHVDIRVMLRVPSTAKDRERVEIGARVKWLVCKEICIPGSQMVGIKLQVSKDTRVVDEFVPTYDAPPRPLDRKESVGAVAVDSGYQLRLSAPWIKTVTQLEFYPYEEATIDHSAPQLVEGVGNGTNATITLRRSPFAAGRAERLRGVIVGSSDQSSRPKQRFGVEIDVPVQ